MLVCNQMTPNPDTMTPEDRLVTAHPMARSTVSPGSATPGTSSFASLVAALSRPDCYPERPDTVDVVQTHISIVFLAGNFVYKLKKPVKFSFLDYSTLAAREFYCHEEVRLNRRLAPTVYLGVVPVLQVGGTYTLGEGEETGKREVADYVVKMCRLPEERTLRTLLLKGCIEKADMVALATKLAGFHATASTKRAPLYGVPEAICRALSDNFQETRPFVGSTLSATQYDKIVDFSRSFLTTHQELFQQRVRAGRVREGHGDLRCEHVYLLESGISVVDCVEFSPRLRTCDVASEVAFLSMDLERHGAQKLARDLIASYSAQAEDSDLLTLLPFYACYRAYVRGKVSSLKSQESEVPLTERENARTEAQQAFRLAYRYARGARTPALIVVCGRIGTGKSTVAAFLNEHTGFSVWNSDVVRKKLAGLPPTARGGGAYQTGIYTDAMTQQTYAALARSAEEELSAGRGVIIDASCRQPAHRRLLRSVAEGCEVPVFFLECQAGARVVEPRLRARARRAQEEAVVSDATWETALQHQADFPQFDDLPDACRIVINTEQTQEALWTAIEETCERLI